MRHKIFLISTGRTGTKFFSEFFLNNVENIASYHTTKYTEIINILGNAYLKNVVSKSVIRKVWKALKYDFISGHTDNHYIESNPYYLGLLDIISESFNDVKYIFIVRRPKGYIISHLNKEYTSIKSKFANRTIPFWQPLPYSDQLHGWKNDFYQRVTFYATIWEYKNRYLNNFRLYNENTRLVKFEDIFIDKNIMILDDLLDWLDLSPVRKIDETVFSQKINSSSPTGCVQWDEKCDDIVNNICEPLMRLLN